MFYRVIGKSRCCRRNPKMLFPVERDVLSINSRVVRKIVAPSKMKYSKEKLYIFRPGKISCSREI